MNRMMEEVPDTQSSGNILLSDRDVLQIEKNELRRRIGLVFQTPTPLSVFYLQEHGICTQVLRPAKSTKAAGVDGEKT